MIEAVYPFISAGFETAAGFICFGQAAGGKASSVWHFLFWLCGYTACWLPVPIWLRSCIFTAVLCLYGILGKEADGKHSFFCALLAGAMVQLSYGVSNSASMLLAPYLFDAASLKAGRLFMIGSDLAALGLSLLLSCAARRVCGRAKEACPGAFHASLLLPVAAIALTGEWIVHSFYGNIVSTDRICAAFFRTDEGLLVIQLAGASCLLSVFHLRMRLSEGVLLGERLSVSKQQIYFQRKYVEEARGYYDSTRALRHDIKNHMAVVRGLLEKKEFDRAKAYLGLLEGVSSGLSFPYVSGNPVIDVLLEEKASLAGKWGVSLAVSLKAPFPETAGDMELCTILSNALDNAICACRDLEAHREITVKSVFQGKMCLLSVENGFSGNTPFQAGTGIGNIRRAAADCGGTAEIFVRGDRFVVNILMGY